MRNSSGLGIKDEKDLALLVSYKRNDFNDEVIAIDIQHTAGPFQRQFRDGQRAGFPRPVLKVADVFAHDGEGIRYGRMYRIAGWHTHSIIWY